MCKQQEKQMAIKIIDEGMLTWESSTSSLTVAKILSSLYHGYKTFQSCRFLPWSMSSSSWPQHASSVCKWMRSVPGLTARSNRRLSLPFQSSNREKKIGRRKGIIWQLRLYFRAMLTTNTIFDHKYQHFQWTLPVTCFWLGVNLFYLYPQNII